MAGKKSPSVDDLTEAEALAVLRQLWAEGGKVRNAIRRGINKYLSRVVQDHVTDAVLSDLDGIAVEELWDRSGDSALGYIHPADESWEIVRERLQPYVRDLERYIRLGRLDESLVYCVGVLEGIYVFGTESDTEFLKWAEDDPQEAFHYVLDAWTKAVSDPALRARMGEELRRRCPKWNFDGR